MELKRNLLNHFKGLQQGVARVQGEAFINAQTFVVEVRLHNKVYRLYPQFVAVVNGKKVYTPRFSPEVMRFSGWRPYFNRPVPELGQKLKFKALLSQHGFATPGFATQADPNLKGVLIKKSVSSFGTEIRGPFKSPGEHALNAGAEEFYEEFIFGEIVKVWFWNAQPVCLERKEMPAVVGNGRQTIAQLAQKKTANRKKMPNWEKVRELLAFCGKDLETVLKAGEGQIVDFRYISEFSRAKDIKEVDLTANTDDFGELAKLGQLLWNVLPEDIRRHVVYSIDAILDRDKKLWFLEVNFNPFVHPNVYPFMIAELETLKEYQELRVVPGVH